ncbi:nuclear transport factor 2 family protein [Microvirga thermotolerans]|nr:nuclear transport factor 2 family protein [Microvirga thermotolerans]
MQVPAPVRAYVDAYDAKDVDGMLRCLTENVPFQNIASGAVNAETNGIDAFAELARMGAAAFRERRQEVKGCIAVGNRVTIEVDYSAVVGADLPNGWKAGQALRFAGASYFELEGGRIARIVDAS